MAGVSKYEQSQIDAVTRASVIRPVERGMGLFAAPVGEESARVHEIAVLPAFRKNRLNLRDVAIAFDDLALLEDVCRWVKTAEVIVVDASGLNPGVLYVLGLCHGIGRSPILIAREGTCDLPFNLVATGCSYYETTSEGLLTLRQDLARRVRVFLASADPFDAA